MKSQVVSTPAFGVTVNIGKHSVVVPPGTEDVIARRLADAGYGTGQWTSLLSGFTKGTPHTPEFRVRSLEGRSIVIRVRPGGNDSCTQHRLIVPKPHDPRDVFDALSANGTSKAAKQPLEAVDDRNDELVQALPCTMEDILGDQTLTDLLLDAVHRRDIAVFTYDDIAQVAAEAFDIPVENASGQKLVHTLAGEGHLEMHPNGSAIGYRLTRKSLERLGIRTPQPVGDDLALAAGVRLSQLRADAEAYMAFEDRRDQIVAELEDVRRRDDLLTEQLGQVQAILEKHPGKTAADKWKKAQALLELPA